MIMWTIRLEGGPKRVNHAAVTVGNRIFSFGGYCSGDDYETRRPMDVFMLNTVNLRWTPLPTPVTTVDIYNSPFQRYGHTAVEYEDNAYIWGGRNDSVGACNTLYRFDTTSFKWDRPEVVGKIPEARDGHSATVVKSAMYIFAGYEEFSDRFSNDLNVLNLKTFTWSFISATGQPARWRDFHTATAVGDVIYIFGGRGDSSGDRFTNTEFYCNKVIAFDISSSTWVQCTHEVFHSPEGRRSHSAFEFRGNIYIFGGYNGVIGCHYNDLHMLNVHTMQWTKLNVPGHSPCPRRRQCACVVGTKVYIFGGTSPKVAKNKPLAASQTEQGSLGPDSDAESETVLVDKSDLYILDLEPSLKTLALTVIIQYKLDWSCLPQDLRWELTTMTTDNNISRQQPQIG